MNKNVVILIAEDNPGHVQLVKRNLWRSCVENNILQFNDGQEILDFLLKRYHSVTVAFLIGLIIGSLWVLWRP